MRQGWWTSDLRIAIAFIRSIQTDDPKINCELQLLADQIAEFIDNEDNGETERQPKPSLSGPVNRVD